MAILLVRSDLMGLGTIMWCYCGKEVVVKARPYNDGEAVFKFYDSDGRMVSVCPDCRAKWRTPQDLEYSEPSMKIDVANGKMA